MPRARPPSHPNGQTPPAPPHSAANAREKSPAVHAVEPRQAITHREAGPQRRFYNEYGDVTELASGDVPETGGNLVRCLDFKIMNICRTGALGRRK